MLKLTVRYCNEAELQHFLQIVRPYIVRCKPHLSKPARKGPESDYYRREIWLKTTVINPGNADNQA